MLILTIKIHGTEDNLNVNIIETGGGGYFTKLVVGEFKYLMKNEHNRM